ncbi:MAG: magnesium transporter CorA family protein [Deltaproteobacteria bacterium]|nr:magnesium transporter CorA family protein [Deltaproteobacteria bacterium]MCB9479515.1 magnesium transporter CorA family protein [Deltaproteobacteria bacterium]MCB9488455.1 magnesium transporter CorA family protein [Deltaproteobacteria bacterium]
MITAYRCENGSLRPTQVDSGDSIEPAAIWIDLRHPTAEEEAAVEKFLGIDVPTRDEMREIEISSRLYQLGPALFMTASILYRSAGNDLLLEPLTFVLGTNRLITVRYSDPMPISQYVRQSQLGDVPCSNALDVFAGLLEAFVDRLADVLENVQRETDGLSAQIFTHPDELDEELEYAEVLRGIGRAQMTTSRVRESLVSISRLLSYVTRYRQAEQDAGLAELLKTVRRDVGSLSDQATFLASNITFLLDATLGVISSEQTDVTKIFSILATLFLPPTLIASIYGMNFHVMPELNWAWGYPAAIALMVLSAVLSYWFVRLKGWL